MDLSDPVIYDLARDAATWSGLVICSAFVLLAPVSFWLLRRSAMGKKQPWLATVLSLPWLMPVVIYLVTLPHHLSAKTAVRDGRAHVLEGTISDFDQSNGPKGRHYECIAIGDTWFHDIPSPLHHDVHPGMTVRIHYIGPPTAPEIVRFERLTP